MDNYEGAMLYYSPCGGTGSGLTDVVCDCLNSIDGRKLKMSY